MPQPEGVTLNEKKLKDLIGLYSRAVKKIVTEFESSTDFGRAQRVELLRRIRAITEQLGAEMNDWADENMPEYYLEGIKEAERELKRIGAEINQLGSFTVIDNDAVSAIVDEVKLGFAESMRGVIRSSQQVLGEATRLEMQEILAQGIITGDARRTISGQVKEILRQRGITSLVDKSGKRWELSTYTNMLVRTKAVEARNVGLGNRMAQNGYDLVQVSNHNSQHQACAVWEGKILSYTGRTPVGTELAGGYRVEGTLDQARAAGLFHPNCKHAINVIHPELAALTKAYQNPYNANVPRNESIAESPDSQKAIRASFDVGVFSGTQEERNLTVASRFNSAFPDLSGFTDLYNWKIQQVPISSLQTHAAADADKVAEYAKGFSRGDVFPTIMAVKQGGVLDVLDGAHRLEALQSLGVTRIPILIGIPRKSS